MLRDYIIGVAISGAVILVPVIEVIFLSFL